MDVHAEEIRGLIRVILWTNSVSICRYRRWYGP